MIRHLLKLVWNRKRSNALIMLEVLCSFLVVFAIAASGLHLWLLYRQPLGFDHRDVWSVGVVTEDTRYTAWTPEHAATFRRLLAEVESMPAVIRVAASTNAPFSSSTSVIGWEYEGRDVEAEYIQTTPTFPEVLGMRLAQGRWFDETDSALDWLPVVIDRRLATQLFGDEDPLGRTVEEPDEPDDTEKRVVGVVDAFRRAGEFMEAREHLFQPANLHLDDGARLDTLVIRTAPGTTAEFEEDLTRRLQAIAGSWSFSVDTLENKCSKNQRDVMLPLLITGTVGGFLLLMVVLGLTGVLWQNVTRRTKEMGLRRAAGATRASIHRQIVAEVMVTAGFGVVVGSLLAIQLPLLGGTENFFGFDVALLALVVSAAFMLALAAACGLYPGWTATRIQPAEALHYE